MTFSTKYNTKKIRGGATHKKKKKKCFSVCPGQFSSPVLHVAVLGVGGLYTVLPCYRMNCFCNTSEGGAHAHTGSHERNVIYTINMVVILLIVEGLTKNRRYQVSYTTAVPGSSPYT